MFEFVLNILAIKVNNTSKGPAIGRISDDSDLIPKIKKGDVSAFEMLVERHKKRAFFAALGMVGDRDAALDLTQDAWVSVFKGIGAFRDGQPFYPWFYRILMNLCKNHLRHRKVVDRVIAGSRDDDCFSEAEGAVFDTDSLVEQREAKALVWRAIDCLPQDQREVILLAHFEGLSYEDIAALVGVPIGTVMSRLFYARKKLAEKLGPVYNE